MTQVNGRNISNIFYNVLMLQHVPENHSTIRPFHRNKANWVFDCFSGVK